MSEPAPVLANSTSAPTSAEVPVERWKNGQLTRTTDFVTEDETKRWLCHISEEANADYVKTSTGYGFVKGEDGRYGYQGATEHDLTLMRAACSSRVLIKAAGGVRSLDTALRMRDLGVSRIGTSSTKAILNDLKRRLAESNQVG